MHTAIYAAELDRFRIDNRRSLNTFRRRRITLALASIRSSINSMVGRTRADLSASSSVLFAAASLATLTATYA